MVKNLPANAGDTRSVPRSGRSLGEGNGNPLQYSCLENPMDGEAWWATVRGVTKSQTRLSDFAFTFKTGRSPSTAPLHQKHKLSWWSPQAITWRLGTGEAAQGAHPRAFDCVVLQQHCNSHEYYLRSRFRAEFVRFTNYIITPSGHSAGLLVPSLPLF